MFGLPDYFWIRVEWTFIFAITCHLLGEYVLTPQWMLTSWNGDYRIYVIRCLLYILPYIHLMGREWIVLILLAIRFGTIYASGYSRRISIRTSALICYVSAQVLYLCPVFWFYYQHWDVMKGA